MFWLFVILCVLGVIALLALAIKSVADRRGSLSKVERADYDAFMQCVYRIEALALENQRAGDYHPFIQIALDEVRQTRETVRNNNRKALS